MTGEPRPEPAGRPRARDLGVPFEGTPGSWNAITDVPGVEVGHATLIRGGDGTDRTGPVVRTGVTAIHPLGRRGTGGVAGGWFALNGHGEMTGTTFLDEIGALFGPVALTNTLSVGVVRDALVAWSHGRFDDPAVVRGRTKPVVAETWDGRLNDVYGFHVSADDAFRALDGARGGAVAEGSVGGGTGMTSFELKAGIGTASRTVRIGSGRYVLGVLVQANFGQRHQLRIAGVPVGRQLPDPRPVPAAGSHGDGSVIAMVATDAPLLPSQARPVAKRASLGLARCGSIASTSSGDLFLAFSTGNRFDYGQEALRTFTSVPTEALDPIFAATVEATEEAIVNALVAAQPMHGHGGSWFPALPHARLKELLRAYGRGPGSERD